MELFRAVPKTGFSGLPKIFREIVLQASEFYLGSSNDDFYWMYPFSGWNSNLVTALL